MATLLRRLFWLVLLTGSGYAAWALWQRRQASEPAAPEWPPLEPPTSTRVADAVPTSDTPPATPATSDEPATADATWVAPVDGACPVDHPIKANDKSGIYHVPGGRFYDRTVPERCYASADAAEADGYRAAKA